MTTFRDTGILVYEAAVASAVATPAGDTWGDTLHAVSQCTLHRPAAGRVRGLRGRDAERRGVDGSWWRVAE